MEGLFKSDYAVSAEELRAQVKRKREAADEAREARARKKEALPQKQQEEQEEARKTKAERELEDADKARRTVFIGGVPITCTKKAVKAFLKQHASVKPESVRFRSIAFEDPHKDRRVSFKKKEFNQNATTMNAYAVLKRQEQVMAVLALNGSEFAPGFVVRVDKATQPSLSHKNSVFVGNLPFDIADAVVRAHFEQCGAIEYVRLIRDGATGLGKGFGYVCFKDPTTVSIALKLHESKLAKRKIRVFQASKQGGKKDRDKKKGASGAARRLNKKAKKGASPAKATQEYQVPMQKRRKKKSKKPNNKMWQ